MLLRNLGYLTLVYDLSIVIIFSLFWPTINNKNDCATLLICCHGAE